VENVRLITSVGTIIPKNPIIASFLFGIAKLPSNPISRDVSAKVKETIVVTNIVAICRKREWDVPLSKVVCQSNKKGDPKRKREIKKYKNSGVNEMTITKKSFLGSKRRIRMARNTTKAI
jgi:hypothetical protein